MGADASLERLALALGGDWLWWEEEEKPEASLQGVVMIRERGGGSRGAARGSDLRCVLKVQFWELAEDFALGVRGGSGHE